jgi:hypothetical protein
MKGILLVGSDMLALKGEAEINRRVDILES